MIIKLRQFLGFDKREATQKEMTILFLEKALNLAKKGHVQVFQGGPKALENAIYDMDKIVYILTIKNLKIMQLKTQKKKTLKEWFERI